MYWNKRTGPMLIVVIVAFVFIQRKVSVDSGVDAEINRIRLAIRRFHERAEGNNRTGADVDWNPFQRGFGCDALASICVFASPEIDPAVAGGKINRPLLRPLRCYRIDQQG